MVEKSGGILTKHQIVHYMEREGPLSELLFVAPLLDNKQIGDTSIDLRLGHYFLVAQPSRLGIMDPVALHNQGGGGLTEGYREVRLRFGEHFTLYPGDTVQVGTLEYLGLPPFLQGLISLRASVSDLPIISRTTQVHPGHQGIVTLTLTSRMRRPFLLNPGLRIAELQLQFTHERVPSPRPSRFHGRTRPSPPRLHEDPDLSYLGRTVEPIIVGVASTIAAGRTTAIKHLVNNYGFCEFSLVEGLKEIASERGILPERRYLQTLGTHLRSTRGGGFLARKLRTTAGWLSCTRHLVIVDGFKHRDEVREFRKQKRFTLLGVTAEEAIRWERVKARNRQGEPKTYEEFLKQDAIDRGLDDTQFAQETEYLVREMADRLIENNESLDDYLKDIDEFGKGIALSSP